MRSPVRDRSEINPRAVDDEFTNEFEGKARDFVKVGKVSNLYL